MSGDGWGSFHLLSSKFDVEADVKIGSLYTCFVLWIDVSYDLGKTTQVPAPNSLDSFTFLKKRFALAFFVFWTE